MSSMQNSTEGKRWYTIHGLYSLSGKTSYRQISWSLEAASAAEMPVKFQSDTTIATSNLAASRLHEIWR